MRVIGITGGIGCGKSRVLNKLKAMGAFVLDCDKLVFELNKKGAPLYCAITDEFGSEYIKANGELDKEKLRELVFANESQLKRLNHISAKVLRKAVEQQIEKAKGYDFCFIEGVRVFEKEFISLFDKVWFITCEKDEQIRRVIKRDGLLKEQAVSIIDSQKSLEKNINLADDVIKTDGTVLQTEQTVEKLYNKLKMEMKNAKL